MRKVLITGVTGFTGRYLAPKLAEAGYEVHGTVHGDPGASLPGVTELHRVDIAEPESIVRLAREMSPDKVVHLAAISFVAHSNVEEMYRTNIVGTRNLLHGLADCAATPSAVLVASSANVYGNSRSGVIDESVSPAPANDYGVTKAATELLAGIYARRLPLIVTRPFNYTGRGQSAEFLIPKIIEHARRRSSVVELGNLEVERDFSDVRAVTDAYLRLIETPAAIGGTFNICSGRATALREVVNLISKLSGHDLKVRVNPAFVRPDEVRSLCGSAANAERVIGPLAMPPLEETLRWMLQG